MVSLRTTSEAQHLKNIASATRHTVIQQDGTDWFDLLDKYDIMALEFGDVVEVQFDYGRVMAVVREVYVVQFQPIVTVEYLTHQGRVPYRRFYTIRNIDSISRVMHRQLAKSFLRYAYAVRVW